MLCYWCCCCCARFSASPFICPYYSTTSMTLPLYHIVVQIRIFSIFFLRAMLCVKVNKKEQPKHKGLTGIEKRKQVENYSTLTLCFQCSLSDNVFFRVDNDSMKKLRIFLSIHLNMDFFSYEQLKAVTFCIHCLAKWGSIDKTFVISAGKKSHSFFLPKLRLSILIVPTDEKKIIFASLFFQRRWYLPMMARTISPAAIKQTLNVHRIV